MTKKTIRLIITLMGAALIGLVSFQIYWINHALRISKEQFSQDVHEALDMVAKKLEKEEALLFVKNNFKSKFRWTDPLTSDSDTIEFFESSFQKKRVVNRNTIILDSLNLTLRDHPVLSFQVETKNGIEIIAEIDEKDDAKNDSTADNDKKDGMLVIKKQYNNSSEINKSVREDFQKIARKVEMYNVGLIEMLSNKRQLKNRITPNHLDSLITEELQNEGIYLAYDYGVLNEESEEFVFSRIQDDHLALRRSGLTTILFPNDMLGTSKLLLNFPDQESFLIRKMWLTFASSIILIIVVVFCFAFAIMTILRQKKLSEIKNDFINNMTHEFKTPISTVSLACEVLLDKTLSNKEEVLDRYINIISVENKRLGVQVEKVLQMALLDKGDFKLKISHVNINKVITEAVDNINIQVGKRGGAIHKSLKADEPIIEADELHISNIIRNLLDNANKYSPEKPEIRVETLNQKEGISIKIIDNGIGLAKESIHKIFDRFYRIPTGNIHNVKGFGLGLAYVKTMVEAHGGRIRVDSELNKGSKFELYFPKINAKAENTTG